MRDLCYNVLTEFYTPVVTSQTLGLTSLLPFSIVWFACNLVNKARGWWRMSSRAKEKVVSAFNRIFKSSDRLEKEAGGSGGGVQGGSPSRRLLRHAGYHVTPSEAQHELQPGSSRPTNQPFFKKKSTKEGANGLDPSYQKSVRSRRLMRELQEIEKNQRKHDSPPFTVELINDNLFDWHVRLYGIDEESELAADMREYGIKCISLQLSFPENFPFVPPFMRVVTPRIEKGFVMEGGAICMELLTPRGWASAYTVEAIVMQFAASIVKGQGRISKKMKNSSKDFNRQSAEESFRSLVKTHEKYGWVTPPLADG